MNEWGMHMRILSDMTWVSQKVRNHYVCLYDPFHCAPGVRRDPGSAIFSWSSWEIPGNVNVVNTIHVVKSLVMSRLHSLWLELGHLHVKSMKLGHLHAKYIDLRATNVEALACWLYFYTTWGIYCLNHILSDFPNNSEVDHISQIPVIVRVTFKGVVGFFFPITP